MSNLEWYNTTGKPLSSSKWLEDHHKAKLPERKKFVQKVLTNFTPTRVIDLGCGTGLWLDLFNEFIDTNCEFIGIDADTHSINEAKERSKNWNRKSDFITCDMYKETDKIPKGDLYLAFNIFPYIHSPNNFIDKIQSKVINDGKLAIRQYDGNTIRFGPMLSEERISIENSLFSSIGQSEQFRHYDLDRIYSVINNSKFKDKNISFETFQRNTPFPNDFINYFDGTIEWTMNYISEYDAEKLGKWYKEYKNSINDNYFVEVDLTAILS